VFLRVGRRVLTVKPAGGEGLFLVVRADAFVVDLAARRVEGAATDCDFDLDADDERLELDLATERSADAAGDALRVLDSFFGDTRVISEGAADLLLLVRTICDFYIYT
jgi:hypothetical protein